MQLPEEARKQAQLDRMRRIATALLVAAAAVFLAAHLLEPRYHWLAFVRATAEAAMVGAIADWFAVTALFRYPLGIRIPHTAIVPTRKDRIGGSLGRFVEHNFLSEAVLSEKVRSMHVAARLAEWLQQTETSERLARHAAGALSTALRTLDEREMQELIEQQITHRLREMEATPVLADALSLVVAGNRRQELLDGTLALIDRLLAENQEHLRERIEREIPWWVPAPIDEKIYRKIFTATETALHDVRANPDHPFRARFDELVNSSVEKLKHSPELIAKGESLKEEFLSSPALESFSGRLWSDLRGSLVPGAGEEARAELLRPIERAICRFGETLADDPELMARVDHWAERAVVHAAEEYRHEVAQLIAHTVEQWDPADTSRKIELQVGKDLQFIRINGTLVGGLVGLLLYTLSVLL